MSAKNYVKIALAEQNIMLKELAEKANTNPANLSRKLNKDTIRYAEVEQIAEILGYEIIWRKKQEDATQQQITNNGFIGIGIQNNNK